MEQIKDFASFMEKEKVRNIPTGQSGAMVCEISGNRVAKWVRRSALQESSLWEKYLHEAAFYRHMKGSAVSFLPRVLFVEQRDEEMLLVMEKYAPLDREALSDVLLEKVVDVLARIHTLPMPGFIQQPDNRPLIHEQEALKGYANGWGSVLREHGNVFFADILQDIARDINQINRIFFSTKRCFTHGDFHFDNLLSDADGNMVVCDWQGCGCGDPSGDLAFLISRLSSDGYPLDADKLVNAYCRCAGRYGLTVHPQDVQIQMALSNLNVSFMYWHMYLHGASWERVQGVFGKMAEDYRKLVKALKNDA